jgi:hypothetical protein
MKKVSIIITIASALLIFNSCCKKPQENAGPDKQLDVNLSSGQNYQLDLGQDDGAITEQASNSSRSAILTDNASGNQIYNYTPASGFEGTDQVVITTGTAETKGCCEKHERSCCEKRERKSCGEKHEKRCGHERNSCGEKNKCGEREKKCDNGGNARGTKIRIRFNISVAK